MKNFIPTVWLPQVYDGDKRKKIDSNVRGETMNGNFNTTSLEISDKIRESDVYQAALLICALLQKRGYAAYFVGGAVRDFVLYPDKIPTDVDISSSASPQEVLDVFPGSGFVGKAFGVSLVKHNSHAFEVATFRKEGTYSDRRHPDFVETGTMEEDSKRRDFTINALYFDPVKKRVTDFHEGVADLDAKVLRCVGEATERLHEDPLRIIRLFRFAANLSFEIAAPTLTAAKKEADGLALLSKERVVMEIVKVKPWRFGEFAQGFLTEIPLQKFLPQLSCELVSKNVVWKYSAEFHHDFPVTSLALQVLERTQSPKDNLKLIWGAFSIWPMATEDLALLRFVTLEFPGFVSYFSNAQENVAAFYLLRTLLRLRKVQVRDIHSLLEFGCGLERSEIASKFSKGFQKIPPRKNQTPATIENWSNEVLNVASKLSSEEIIKSVEARGLPKHFVGVWNQWQDVTLLAAQLRVPLVADETSLIPLLETIYDRKQNAPWSLKI